MFAAADAKGLADQGLSKQAITNVLNSTGLNSQVAAEAAALATSGQTADQIAVALSNRFGGTTINGQKTLYTNGGDGVSNSVIGGANTKALESIQKVEDGILISQDAKNIYENLKTQGLTGRAAEPAIIQNLVATGVDPKVAAYVADKIGRAHV